LKYKFQNSKESDLDFKTPDKILQHKGLMQFVGEMLDECDKDARAVLGLWKLSYSFNEIAEQLNLRNAAQARKIKFRALKKLYILVNRYPEYKDYYT
jgi:hypothetical protein